MFGPSYASGQAGGLVAAPLAAEAHHPGKVYRIGVLAYSPATADSVGPEPKTDPRRHLSEAELPDDVVRPRGRGVCVACEQPIAPNEVEVECDLPGGGTIRLHRSCYDIWSVEWPCESA